MSKLSDCNNVLYFLFHLPVGAFLWLLFIMGRIFGVEIPELPCSQTRRKVRISDLFYCLILNLSSATALIYFKQFFKVYKVLVNGKTLFIFKTMIEK